MTCGRGKERCWQIFYTYKVLQLVTGYTEQFFFFKHQSLNIQVHAALNFRKQQTKHPFLWMIRCVFCPLNYLSCIHGESKKEISCFAVILVKKPQNKTSMPHYFIKICSKITFHCLARSVIMLCFCRIQKTARCTQH